ncbi:hypothetical protein LTR70_000902 [Exophiala xenobiotica]|uniref:DNA replication regulator SLD2 n=1 Tax=Lithohypha guttulata TaxID=1690604 RepID=A0ABR0KK59_9EURO|nr:hypothetical protein LTR24_001605 [Lithohypha guttulata]KAK5329066.1 hypothetical protein LTR70_000902 [Exophiala xenobiotica]
MDVDREPLLDSPKRAHLHAQSIELRAALKTFERTFAEQNGRKPKQNDIKNDPSVAVKYKQYHKVQDVLVGRLAYEKLYATKPLRKSKDEAHRRQDSGVGSSPREQQRSLQETPRKSSQPFELDPYDVRNTASPKSMLMNAIAPTPHRDGKVLGLFDLLQGPGSGKSSAATPSSSARKRKVDELYQDTPARRSPLKVIQTPSHRSGKKQGDLLQFLGETPQKSSGIGMGKHSRTPQSEGKRFQLSQFFATPSTQRFLFSSEDGGAMERTPLRDTILGRTPQKQIDTAGLDATPTYLKRSTSFKDRLLSATQTPTVPEFARPNPATKRTGPPTLKHFRSSTSNILTMSDIQPRQSKQRQQLGEQGNDNVHDDDLEALRELEGQDQSPHVLVEDSQLNIQLPASGDEEGSRPLRPYKKKGQKRTTRKSTIRPISQAKASVQPKFVAADGFDEEDDEGDRDEKVEETTIMSDDEQGSDFDGSANEEDVAKPKVKRRKGAPSKESTKTTKTVGKSKKQAGMINPNAQSHTNYRSLKIKNNNSKAKGGGRGRFGRGRR